MDKNFSFKSERLIYRGIRYEDSDLIVAWRSDPANYKNFFNQQPLTKKDHLCWFEGYLTDPTRFDFMIQEPNKKSVGTCSLSNISGNSCEISYMIGDENCRGKGYAKEAVRALSEVAFEQLNVKEIIARILPHNEASIHVVLGSGYYEYERIYRLNSND